MNSNLMMQLRVYLAVALGNKVPVNYFPYNSIEDYFLATDAWLFGLR